MRISEAAGFACPVAVAHLNVILQLVADPSGLASRGLEVEPAALPTGPGTRRSATERGGLATWSPGLLSANPLARVEGPGRLGGRRFGQM